MKRILLKIPSPPVIVHLEPENETASTTSTASTASSMSEEDVEPQSSSSLQPQRPRRVEKPEKPEKPETKKVVKRTKSVKELARKLERKAANKVPADRREEEAAPHQSNKKKKGTIWAKRPAPPVPGSPHRQRKEDLKPKKPNREHQQSRKSAERNVRDRTKPDPEPEPEKERKKVAVTKSVRELARQIEQKTNQEKEVVERRKQSNAAPRVKTMMQKWEAACARQKELNGAKQVEMRDQRTHELKSMKRFNERSKPALDRSVTVPAHRRPPRLARTNTTTMRVDTETVAEPDNTDIHRGFSGIWVRLDVL